jgi:hypothetical protein
MTDLEEYEPDPDAAYEAWAEQQMEDALAKREEDLKLVKEWNKEAKAAKASVDALELHLRSEYNSAMSATAWLLTRMYEVE